MGKAAEGKTAIVSGAGSGSPVFLHVDIKLMWLTGIQNGAHSNRPSLLTSSKQGSLPPRF
jgi:hypothetical protein